MKTGTLKFFNEAKGFGFIIPDDTNSNDVFFHITGSNERGFTKGQRVQYELSTSNKGAIANNVTKI